MLKPHMPTTVVFPWKHLGSVLAVLILARIFAACSVGRRYDNLTQDVSNLASGKKPWDLQPGTSYLKARLWVREEWVMFCGWWTGYGGDVLQGLLFMGRAVFLGSDCDVLKNLV